MLALHVYGGDLFAAHRSQWDDETIALVASAWGNDAHPAWFLDLRDDPWVTVRTEAGTRPMTARIVEGDERTRRASVSRCDGASRRRWCRRR